MRRETVELPPPPRIENPGHPFRCGRLPGQPVCESGPNLSGNCPILGSCSTKNSHGKAVSQKPCRPQPTWAGRRRRITSGFQFVFASVLLVGFGTRAAPHLVQPGDLSAAHSQILEGSMTEGRCAVCHVNASAENWSMLKPSEPDRSDLELVSAGATMTDRCAACHRDLIPSDLTRAAHNLSAQDRIASTQNLTSFNNSLLIANVSISQEDVACAVCHREHHGGTTDLTEITDSRCQTCHANQFGSFGTSHPEFRDYPSADNRVIAFDHNRHANLHFPKKNNSGATSATAGDFDCRQCHDASPQTTRSSFDGTFDLIVATLPFEIACASCHDETLKTQVADGPALFELPILPRNVAEQIESWPEAAIGTPDGKLSAWMTLVLRREEPTIDWNAWQDLSRIDWSLPQTDTEAVVVGRAVRRFMIRLASQGQLYLHAALKDAGADEPTATAIAQTFPTQLVTDAVVDWFGKNENSTDRFSTRSERSSSGGIRMSASDRSFEINDTDEANDALLDWSSADDDVLLLPDNNPPNTFSDPSADTSADVFVGNTDWESKLRERFDAATQQSFGGWYRDDVTLSVRYRGSGHGDVVLRSFIETLWQSGKTGSEFVNLVDTQPAVAACLECHSNKTWQSSPDTSLTDRLTRFTHQPHLNIKGLQDCRHCHELTEPPVGVVAFRRSARQLTRVNSDFLPLQKQACVACHTRTAAGDSCTTCHRYHVGHESSSLTVTEPQSQPEIRSEHETARLDDFRRAW